MRIDKERKKSLTAFQKLIKVRFKCIHTLNRALTHRSYVNEANRKLKHNETLEYLGDSVLALGVNEYLFIQYPDFTEKQLARIKSVVVSRTTLTKIARSLNLGQYLLIGHGEEKSGGRDRQSILADAMESIIGAVYYDCGVQRALKFVRSYFVPEIELVLQGKHTKDYKSMLQEQVQKIYQERPYYRLIRQTGPDHQRIFEMTVIIHGHEYGSGSGSSKRNAEQEAAEAALHKFLHEKKHT